MASPNKNKSILGLLDDTSIFIGLTSMPMGKEKEFNKEILAHIKKHKDRTEEYSISKMPDDIFTNYLYVPKTFFIFGTFDLATLSLIDDFEFCTQAFHPFDPIYPTAQELYENYEYTQDPDGESGRRYFAHHMIVGPAPCWSENKQQIIKLAFDTFIFGPPKNGESDGPRMPLPLIGICQLKINNGLLIGSGTDILRCVIRVIKKVFNNKPRKENHKHPKVQIIILESWSWHELTLLLFSDSYKTIIDFVVELGELNIGQMNDILGKDDPAMKEFRISDCLISKIIDRNANIFSNHVPDLNLSHLFWNSTTTLGFRFEIFEKGNVAETHDLLQAIDPNDHILPFSRWHSRGGHAITGSGILTGKEPSSSINDIRICIGRGDIVWPCNGEINCKTGMNTIQFIDRIVKARTQNRLEDHILSANTIISIEPTEILKDKEGNLKYNVIDENRHFPFLSNIVKSRLTKSVSNIRRDLYSPIRQKLLPKVVAERVFNSIAQFNEGFDDPFLLSSFLELYPYVNTLIREVNKLSIKYKDSPFIRRAADFINDMVEISSV